MPKRYEVLERSFINGRLYEPGETLVLEIDSPGGNLKQLGGSSAPTASPSNQSGAAGTGLGYVAARGAAGKFVVKNGSDERVGEFVGTKAEAEAEAARLNAGGEIATLPNQSGAAGSAGGTGGVGGEPEGGSGLPDA